MVYVQAAYFLLSDGTDPIGCNVNITASVMVEVVYQAGNEAGPSGVDEEATSLWVGISDAIGNYIKCYQWDGRCLVKGSSTYTTDTLVFTLPTVGTYDIVVTTAEQTPIGGALECNITLAEVTC